MLMGRTLRARLFALSLLQENPIKYELRVAAEDAAAILCANSFHKVGSFDR